MNKHSVWRHLLVSILAVVFLTGCVSAPTHVAYRKAIRTEYGKQAGFSPAEKEYIADNCPLGVPKRNAGIDFGFTRIIARQGYVLEHSAEEKIPLWVCEHVTKAAVDGPLTRPKPEPFKPDPALAGGLRSELKDYVRSGYDRGHQAPSADQTVDRTLQAETFYLSNMCPQTAALNQKAWQKLEDLVRDQARAAGAVYVITGPMFYEEAEEEKATADGYVKYTTIGENGVAVPTHFYKVVQWKDDRGKWQGVAFVMKNQREPFPKPYDFSRFIRPVRWIEERTGLDFNPELPGLDANRLELEPGHMWK